VLCNKLDEVLVKCDDAKNKGVRFNAAFYIDTVYDAVVNCAQGLMPMYLEQNRIFTNSVGHRN